MKDNLKNEYNAAFDLIDRNLKDYAEKIAFVDDNTSITYKELFINIQKVSHILLDLGLKKGDKVILCAYDSIYYPICFLGAIWSGIIPICINTMLPKKDIKYMIEDSESNAVITSPDLLNTFEIIKEEINEKFLIICDTHINDKYLSIQNLLKTNKNKVIKPATTYENDVCFWLYSSGSTGSPKGTLHIHKNIISTANTYAREVLNISSSDICFSAAKLFFAYGLGNALTFPMSVGATSILISSRPTPDLVASVINNHNVTLFFGVPTLYAAILNSRANSVNFESLRLSISAGEALPAHLCDKWKSLTNTNVLDGIGSTEMLHIFISNRIDELTPGASGRPVSGYEARLISDTGDTILENNEIGELEIKGPSSAISYWNKPEKSKITFRGKWTKTGDKYIKDENGIYTYCGRADDMMKVSGQYVSPFEVEAALQSHDSVLEAAVVSNKDKDDLIKPKAYIVLNNGYKADKSLELELTNYVKSKLTPFKYPRWYEFIKELPKTATGKIQRFKLRKDD